MAFENTIFADIGLFRELHGGTVDGVTRQDLNGYMRYYEQNTVSPAFSADHFSGTLGGTQISHGEWRNLFGFALKQNGVFTGKYAVCRCYGSIVDNTPANIKRVYQIQWYLYDPEATQQYTEIASYFVEPNFTQIGQIKMATCTCSVMFRVEHGTFWGEEQNLIYGGLYLKGTGIYGLETYQCASIGLQGIGLVTHLGAYDPIDTEGVIFDPDFGPEGEEGGYGPTDPGGSGGGSGGPGPTFDGVSDPWIDYTLKPGIAALGLVNLYKCDAGSLVNLGAELFPDIHWPTSLSDVGEVLAAVSDSIWNSKLIDYIVSAHIIPIDVTGGNLEDIKVGTRTMTGILARPITDDIVEFDCGTIHIDEYYTSFVDYMTRARLYLPFYGFINLKSEYWQSADLQVKYRFNVIDGSFIALVYSTISRHQKLCKTLIGQYTGCACVHVPMTGASYASMFGGMISGAAGMAAGLATMNPALAATSAINVAASSAGNMESSNSYNASAGFYGHPCPYLIIERPVSHFSTLYNTERGLPLMKAMTIGSCSGFTQAEDVILDGIPCTDAEKEKIRSMFKSGVIIKAIN